MIHCSKFYITRDLERLHSEYRPLSPSDTYLPSKIFYLKTRSFNSRPIPEPDGSGRVPRPVKSHRGNQTSWEAKTVFLGQGEAMFLPGIDHKTSGKGQLI